MRGLREILAAHAEATVDAQEARYVHPRGPTLHLVELIPQNVQVLASGSTAWEPGEVLVVVRPRGSDFWVIVSAPPAGKGGASITPLAATTSTVTIIPAVEQIACWGVWCNDGETINFDLYNVGTGEFITNGWQMTDAAAGWAFAAAGPSYPFRTRENDMRLLYTRGTLVHVDPQAGTSASYTPPDYPTAGSPSPLRIVQPMIRGPWLYWLEVGIEGTHTDAPNPLRLIRAPYTTAPDFTQWELVEEKTDLVAGDTEFVGSACDYFYAYVCLTTIGGPDNIQVGLPLDPNLLLSQTTCTDAAPAALEFIGTAYMTAEDGGGGGVSLGIGTRASSLAPAPGISDLQRLRQFQPGCTTPGNGFTDRDLVSAEFVTNVDLNAYGHWLLAYRNTTGELKIGDALGASNSWAHEITLAGNPASVDAVDRPNGYPGMVFFGTSDFQEWGV